MAAAVADDDRDGSARVCDTVSDADPLPDLVALNVLDCELVSVADGEPADDDVAEGDKN